MSDPSPWETRIRACPGSGRRRGALALPREFDALGPSGVFEGGRVGVLRVQRLPRIERAPGRGGGGAGGARTLGRRLGRLPPGHRDPPHPRRAGAGVGRMEGDRGGRVLPDRLRGQPRCAEHARGPGRPGAVGRAESRQHHRWLPALPFSARRVPPPGHGPSGRAADGAPPPRAPAPPPAPPARSRPSSSPTRSSPWMGTPPRWRSSSRSASATAPCWSSMRPTPSSAPTSLGPPGGTGAGGRETGAGPAYRGERSCGSARCPRHWARWAASWRHPATSSTSWSTGPAPTSSPPRLSPADAAAALAALAVLRSAKGRR